jgi:aminopeptidase N
MQDSQSPETIYRADYKPPEFLIDTVDLRFDLDDRNTRVRSMLAMRRNDKAATDAPHLHLDGHQLTLIEIALDGSALIEGQDYLIDQAGLTVLKVPDSFVLELVTEIDPATNTELEGLYQSSGNFCTQCEPQGFRRITYFLDRPDVMARYSVKIVADLDRFPVLLSNGNLTNSGTSDDGRHWVRWEDPHPKPSYLFALVAGDLVNLKDSFTTASGRLVDLYVYVQAHNIDKCDHAMASLKKAMRWDEQEYDREYDLDVYMIVAVDDFNMGAMENKGLNIFNSKFVLADQASATDDDFMGVESVVAHEYFHNWTGNRITCRDWFQLSLKEGLTVFRDQEFTASLHSAAVKRIEDVRLLREHQFVEDAGPMAHPVRPDSYIEINNFYTVTVYEKGAEVIRMLRSLIGDEQYDAGVALYFDRHDGQAVTCDDFVVAMEDASGVDLTQFRRWYSQSGTPVLKVDSTYDADERSFTVTLTQSCGATPGQNKKLPFDIPIQIAMFAEDGTQLSLRAPEQPVDAPSQADVTLRLTESQASYTFSDIDAAPILSVLRNFTAPVELDYVRSNSDYAFLMRYETDPFARWEAGQRLVCAQIERAMEVLPQAESVELDESLAIGLESLMTDERLDDSLRALSLKLPDMETVAANHKHIDIDAIGAASDWLMHALAQRLREQLEIAYATRSASEVFSIDGRAIGRRRLRNAALRYLAGIDTSWCEVAQQQFQSANNMTDRVAAVTTLLDSNASMADDVVEEFYQNWKTERLVVDKWFSIQARARDASVLDRVERLLEHPDFDLSNPNRARSLIGSFAAGNPRAFHCLDGRGYKFLSARILEMDSINPQVAARFCVPLTRWRRFDSHRQGLMCDALQRVLAKDGLSADVYEIASKAVSAGSV